MSKKNIDIPLLPYDVAKAIEAIRENGNDKILFNFPAIANYSKSNEHYKALSNYFNKSREHFNQYFVAITVGYDTDNTVEEKIADLFHTAKAEKRFDTVSAIFDILDWLNVEIEGVNHFAPEEDDAILEHEKELEPA